MKISNTKNYNIEKYVKLHLENLPNDFFSLLGKKLCKKYYEILLDIKNKPELFEIKIDKNIIGFVLFNLTKHNAMYDFCKKNFIFITFFLIINIFNFKLIIDCIKILFFLIDTRNLKLSNELSFIVLDKTYIGKGFGSKLIKYSLKKIDINKEDYFFVKTLTSTPENIHFYIKNEFKIIYSKYNRTLLKYE